MTLVFLRHRQAHSHIKASLCPLLRVYLKVFVIVVRADVLLEAGTLACFIRSKVGDSESKSAFSLVVSLISVVHQFGDTMRAAPPASLLEFTGYTITTLPSDVLCTIFAKMEKFEDLAVCGCVCRRWNSILEQVTANSIIMHFCAPLKPTKGAKYVT